MSSPQLDFYAPAPDHRKMNKEKLGRQREEMFSWRRDHKKTEFDAKTGARKPILNRYEMAHKQIVLPGSQREAEMWRKKKQQEETIWDYASGTPSDRRREWRATGFTFDDEHFRTSDDPRSKYYVKNKPRMTAASLRAKQKAIQQHPYVPYYHDAILLSCPASGEEVTCLAVTCNKEEAMQRELHASKAARQARLMNSGSGQQTEQNPNSWCEALGPAISSKQRNMELAQTMYHDLICRQAALTETEVGSPESMDINVPTSEIAYSIRAEYLRTHQTNHPISGTSSAEKLGGHPASASTASSQGRRHGKAATAAAADNEEEQEDTTVMLPSQTLPHVPSSATSLNPHPQRGTSSSSSSRAPRTTTAGTSASAATHRSRDGAEEGGSSVTGATSTVHQTDEMNAGAGGHHLLPAEAKASRLYAIQLRRFFSNEESSMTMRQEPVRQGVPVNLPASWQSPLLHNS